MKITKTFLNKVFINGFVIVIILVLLDLLTFFFYPNTIFSEIFLATREQTPLTWISAVLLFLIGFSSALIYHHTNNRLWYCLSIIYFFFSMDDATYFHERFSAGIQELIPLFSDFPSYSWIIIYFPLLVFGIAGILYLLWEDADIKERKMLKYAVLFLGTAVFLDMLDGLVGKDPTLVFCMESSCSSGLTHILRLIEETLEVFGFGLLAYLSLVENHKKVG